MDSIIGKKFNRLLVLNETEKRTKNRSKIYLCLCDCGIEKEICGDKLKRGTKSCGCLKAENLNHGPGDLHHQYNGYNLISGSFWGRIRDSAKVRKKEFNITIEYCWNLFLIQDGKCAISKVDIRLSQNTKDLYNKSITASLDRIDSSKGYIEGNVQWVHKNVNYMKFRFEQQEFIDWCKIIATVN